MYYQAMSNMKSLYFQAIKKQKEEGKLKSINDFLTAASAKEREKKYNRSAAEAYGMVAMQYELEGNKTLADDYYKKSLSAYPTPIMMTFYHLLKIKRE